MGFTYQSPSFQSQIYNPSFYTSTGDYLSIEEASLLFLSKNDYRISFLNSNVGTASAGNALIVDSNKDIIGINNIGCSTINGQSLSNLSLLDGITAGFISDSKCVIVDSNRDIAGFRTITTSHVSPYTGLTCNQQSAAVSLQMNSLSYSSFGTTSAHGFALMSSNENRLTISALGNIAIGSLPTSYKLDVNGSFNCDSLYIDGSLANLNVLAGETGVATANMALVVDANRELSGMKKLSFSHPSPYTPWEAYHGSASISLQVNNLSYSSLGTTSSHGFALMTSNENRIRIDASGKIGIPTINSSYNLNIDGTINSTGLYVNGVAVGTVGSTTDLICNTFTLNQTGPSSSRYYAFESNPNPSRLVYQSSGITGDGYYAIASEASIGSLAVQQKWDRQSGNYDLVHQAWVGDYRISTSTYRAQLALRLRDTASDAYHWDFVGSSNANDFINFKNSISSETLHLDLGSRRVGINISAVSDNCQLDVNGTIRGRSNLWLGNQVVELTDFSQRRIVSINNTMTTSQKAQLLLGRSTANYDNALLTYVYISPSSSSNRVSLGFQGNENILNILANSNVGIGTTTPLVPLDVRGAGSLTIGVGGTSYTAYVHECNINPLRSSQASGLGPYTMSNISARFAYSIFVESYIWSSSDRRLKENIIDLDIDLDEYKKFRPVSFNWKADEQKRPTLGLIAQDVMEIASEVVSYGIPELDNEHLQKTGPNMPEGVKLTIDYNQLTALNMKAIQILIDRIEYLEAQVKKYMTIL